MRQEVLEQIPLLDQRQHNASDGIGVLIGRRRFGTVLQSSISDHIEYDIGTLHEISAHRGGELLDAPPGVHVIIG